MNKLTVFRNSKIDLLRGFSILVVLILHFNIAYNLSQSVLNKIFSVDFIHSVARNGNYGVTIFFVISGFLITTTTIERYGKLGDINIIRFYILRFARIMPCLLLLLGIICIFNLMPLPIFKNDPNTTSLLVAVFSVLTLWHNYLMEKIGYFNYCLNILWSLSVEEIFYFAFPLVCLLFKNTRIVFSLLCILIILGPLYRSFYVNNEIVALYANFSCFDAIAIGCCTAIVAGKIYIPKKSHQVMRGGAILLMLTVYFYSSIMLNVVFGVSLMALGAAIFIIAAVSDRTTTKVSSIPSKIIQWFGINSYELYLFHIIILALMKEIYEPAALSNYGKLAWFIIFLSVSALFSHMISMLYSRPMNKITRMFLLNLAYRKKPLNNGEV